MPKRPLGWTTFAEVTGRVSGFPNKTPNAQFWFRRRTPANSTNCSKHLGNLIVTKQVLRRTAGASRKKTGARRGEWMKSSLFHSSIHLIEIIWNCRVDVNQSIAVYIPEENKTDLKQRTNREIEKKKTRTLWISLELQILSQSWWLSKRSLNDKNSRTLTIALQNVLAKIPSFSFKLISY